MALLLFCVQPGPTAPATPLGPDTLGQHQSGRFEFYAPTERTERTRFVVRWGDGEEDSSSFLRAGDTIELAHAWADTGAFSILCRAQDETGRLSAFSPAHPVLILNYPPATPAAVFGPDTVRAESTAEFRTATTDPEADLISYIFDWGDGDSVTAPGYASGDTARMLHAWSDTGAFQVRVKARDEANHDSQWSSPHSVIVVP